MIENRRYIITQDNSTVLPSTRASNNTGQDYLSEASQAHLDTVRLSLRTAFGNQREVEVYSKADIDNRLSSKATTELASDPETVCVCLDKFLLSSIETSDDYKNRFFRFDICRTTNGSKAPRQGGMSFSEQVENLREKIPDLEKKRLLIVDSGIYTGGTIKDFLRILSTEGVESRVKKIVCFVGDKKHLDDPELRNLEILESIDGMYDWVDLRDFSPLGGKKFKTSDSNKISSSVPYLFPWSDGSNASLDNSPHLFTASLDILESFRRLLAEHGNVNGMGALTFKRLIKNGFSLPISLEKNIPISINDTLNQYLERCIQEIKAEQNRPVIVLDMDGTLYELDGKEGGFKGSKLDKTVMDNALSFIREKEECSHAEAEAVLHAGVADEIGLSAYLSRKYGITRDEYFDAVWNISPDGIISKGEHAREVIPLLKLNPQLKVILLTHSPAVWARQVLRYLGITDHFESIFSGDQHGQKDEVFALLAGRYRPENIISVGDQYETDIKPAENLGMKTLLVRSPEDIKEVLRMLDS